MNTNYGECYVKVDMAEAKDFKANFKERATCRATYVATKEGLKIKEMSVYMDGKTYIGGQGQYEMASAPMDLDIPAMDIPLENAISNSSVKAPVTAIDKTIDQNIPISTIKKNNVFAVIIGNERYQRVAHVPYANNDAKIFAEYCKKTLGLPDKNVKVYENATYGTMIGAVSDIQKIAKAFKGDINVIFYYAGHGVPDDDGKEAYLLPTDADGRRMRLCYRLNELYQDLASLGADNTTVFLDACFSGATREKDKMLKQERGVAIKVKEKDVPGRMVVFSAASGSQTAAAYDDEHHGMFTYYLLEKLKETKGNVDLGTLGEYVTSKVALQSRLKNNKDQTPTVMPGAGMDGNWKKLRLR